jgi:hypothetical protein
MGLDIQQRIAQVQQKIGAKDAAGKSTAGLQKKLAKLLKKLGAANTAAGVAVTLGIASLVIPSGAAPSGGPDLAPPPGTTVVGSDAGGGLVWGVTVGSDSPTPGDTGAGDTGSSAPAPGLSDSPADPGAPPADGGNSSGSTGSESGAGSGGSADPGGQDSSGGDGSTGAPGTTDSDTPAEYEDGE